MNETIQTLLARRSVRAYTEEPVSREDMNLILKCALYAPSGGNHQEVRFTVVEKRKVLDDLIVIARNEFRQMSVVEGRYWNTAIINAQANPDYNFTLKAPALVIATAPAGWTNGMADSANALQNMHIAASSLGLGACWVNQLRWLTDNNVMRQYLLQYGIDEGEEIYGSMVFGHPQIPLPKAAPRKPNRITYIRQEYLGGLQ